MFNEFCLRVMERILAEAYDGLDVLKSLKEQNIIIYSEHELADLGRLVEDCNILFKEEIDKHRDIFRDGEKVSIKLNDMSDEIFNRYVLDFQY